MSQMSKTIKCVLFRADTVLITQIEEVDAELGEPNCKLIKPYHFISEDDMKPWPNTTNQTEMLVSSESILTIVDPKPEIVKKYLELISE
jgi:hypothetical protein